MRETYRVFKQDHCNRKSITVTHYCRSTVIFRSIVISLFVDLLTQDLETHSENQKERKTDKNVDKKNDRSDIWNIYGLR